MIDVPDDYEPTRHTRISIVKLKRAPALKTDDLSSTRLKKTKATAVRCTDDCRRTIEADDPFQKDAIQCCHHNDIYPWIKDDEGCSR